MEDFIWLVKSEITRFSLGLGSPELFCLTYFLLASTLPFMLSSLFGCVICMLHTLIYVNNSQPTVVAQPIVVVIVGGNNTVVVVTVVVDVV